MLAPLLLALLLGAGCGEPPPQPGQLAGDGMDAAAADSARAAADVQDGGGHGTPSDTPAGLDAFDVTAAADAAAIPDVAGADTIAPDTTAPDTIAADTIAADTIAADTIAADTIAADTIAADTIAADTMAPDTIAADTIGGSAIRVVTLNCRCLLDQPKLRAAAIAKELHALGADAVGLQEICRTKDGKQDFGQMLSAQLSKLTATAWSVTWAKTHVAWDKYEEGIAILAPTAAVQSTKVVSLPQGSGPFPRKVIHARLQLKGRTFDLYDTHLTISKVWQDRLAQVKSLLKTVASQGKSGVPQVVVGDFNDKDWSGPVKAMVAGPPGFVDAWAAKGQGVSGDTVPADKPSERIDYLFIDAASKVVLSDVQVNFAQPTQGLWPSDHRGVSALLTW